jgi:dihydroorotate dehydrogenase
VLVTWLKKYFKKSKKFNQMTKQSKKFAYAQSGVMGFFGRVVLFEYLYQLFYWLIPGYTFRNCIFVAKTVTLEPRKGNTELRGFRIRRFFPKSIWISFHSWWHGYMLNAVGLSNPGLSSILNEYEWQRRTDNGDYFHISIQLDKTSPEEVKQEIIKICNLLRGKMYSKHQAYAIQLNKSCPNTGEKMAEEVSAIITELKTFNQYLPEIKVWVKFNALISVKVLKELVPHCEGFVISNTIPFGACPELIDWKKLFPGGESPLRERLGQINGEWFDGGLSGAPVFPVLVRCLSRIENSYLNTKIIAGGGVMSKRDVAILKEFDCVNEGISLGTVGLLRPHSVNGLAKYINKLLNQKTTVK